jgi:hypothetical protein
MPGYSDGRPRSQVTDADDEVATGVQGTLSPGGVLGRSPGWVAGVSPRYALPRQRARKPGTFLNCWYLVTEVDCVM